MFLKQASRGQEVLALKRLLYTIPHIGSQLNRNDVFDDALEQAIIKFKKENGIHPLTSETNQEFWSALGQRVHPTLVECVANNNHTLWRTLHSVKKTRMLWPTVTHENILKEVFSGLRLTEITSMQKGSESVDIEGLNPKTLWEKEAYKHAMVPGYKIKELGSESAAREWAKKEAQKWIDNKLYEASVKQKSYLERAAKIPGKFSPVGKEALYSSGEASHTVMDNSSPAHRDFQVYDNTKYKVAASFGTIGIIIGGVWYGLDMKEHSKIESRKPNESEMKEMRDKLHEYFLKVFGDTGYEYATKKK